MQADLRDHHVERKIGIPVYLEGQVAGVDWLVQLFYLIVVQLIVRIFKAIIGAYEPFLQEKTRNALDSSDQEKHCRCQKYPVSF